MKFEIQSGGKIQIDKNRSIYSISGSCCASPAGRNETEIWISEFSLSNGITVALGRQMETF